MPSFHRIFSLLWIVAATLGTHLAKATCLAGKDSFYSYIRLDLDIIQERSLHHDLLTTLFSQSFNQLAAPGCDFDRRRILSTEINKSEINNEATKLSFHMKSKVQYKGPSVSLAANIPPPSSKIPTLFGPETFQEMYVEQECACQVEGLPPTGVSLAAFQKALQSALETVMSSSGAGAVNVTHVEELAVSAAC